MDSDSTAAPGGLATLACRLQVRISARPKHLHCKNSGVGDGTGTDRPPVTRASTTGTDLAIANTTSSAQATLRHTFEACHTKIFICRTDHWQLQWMLLRIDWVGVSGIWRVPLPHVHVPHTCIRRRQGDRPAHALVERCPLRPVQMLSPPRELGAKKLSSLLARSPHSCWQHDCLDFFVRNALPRHPTVRQAQLTTNRPNRRELLGFTSQLELQLLASPMSRTYTSLSSAE